MTALEVSITSESLGIGSAGHSYTLTYALVSPLFQAEGSAARQRRVSLTSKEHLFYNTMRRQLSSCASIPVQREVEVAQLEHTLRDKGTRLFNHFFSELDTKEIIQTGGLRLQLDSSLLAFPWELMRSPGQGTIDAVAHPVSRALALPNDSFHRKEVLLLDSPKILFLGADPQSLAASTRAEGVLEQIESSFPEGITATSLISDERKFAKAGLAQYERFWQAVREYEPSIVHVVAHGRPEALGKSKGLVLEGEDPRSSHTVSMELVLRALEGVESVRILIITACQSGPLFEECIEQVRHSPGLLQIEAVVCVAADISVQANFEFTRGLYRGLWSNLDLANAVAYARQALLSRDEFRLQWSSPMLYETSPVNPFARLIERVEGLKNLPPLEKEYFDLVELAAINIGESVEGLVRCSEQLRPSKTDRAFWLSKLKIGLDALENSLKMFEGRRFASDDRTLLHELERQCHRSMLVLYHYIDGNPSATIEKIAAASQRIEQQVRVVQDATRVKRGG